MAAVSPLGRASGVERRDAPADALTGLYERHASRVFHYCLSWLRSREEAEDAVQTTFLYAYRGLDRGVVPVQERPWLLAIARNVCLSRTHAARRRAVEVVQDPHTLEETVAAPASTNELDGLTDALATLTEQQRNAILLREWHGLAYSEIAERLELSQAAVETLLFRARRSLARRLRQPLEIGSLLPWLRSLAGGGAAKVAVGVAAVAVTATTGAIAVAHQHQPRRITQTPAAHGVAATHFVAAARRQPARSVAFAKQQHGALLHVPATRAATPRTNEPVQPTAQSRPDGPVAAAPIATPAEVAPTALAQAITTSATTTTATATTTTADTAGTVVDTATTAAATVTNTVSNTVAPTVGTVADTATTAAATVVTTAQDAIAAVTSVVPKLLGPKLP
jgi:RNA polymerase sigma-70 factor (ECF subfamily)